MIIYETMRQCTVRSMCAVVMYGLCMKYYVLATRAGVSVQLMIRRCNDFPWKRQKGAVAKMDIKRFF